MGRKEDLFRVPDDQAEEIYKELAKPYLPPGGDYELTKPHPARDEVTKILGIQESLVKPSSTPPDDRHWITQALDNIWNAPEPAGSSSDSEDDNGKNKGNDDDSESDNDIGYVGRSYGEKKKLFWNGKGKRTLAELKSTNADGLGGWWRPIRPEPKKVWPGKEIETEWYSHMYTSLFLRTKKFVGDNFGYGQVRPSRKVHGIPNSVWLEIPEILRNYIAAVARQDNHVPGGWDELIVQSVHRVYVIQGVIGKVFQKYIWEELLFGASEKQKELLEAEDKLTVDLDGFKRTANRAETVRSLLGADLETPLFWEKVDELTLRIITLLLPLINVLDYNSIRARESSLRAIYQELHYLVTQAGFLAVGIRWSHDIFRFEWPIPGLPFDSEQQNIDAWPYDRSARFAKMFDESEEQARQKAEELASDEDDGSLPLDKLRTKVWDPLWDRVVAYAMAGVDPVSLKARRDWILQPTQSHSLHRMAKVQIAIWPAFVRHEIVGKLGEHPISGHLEVDGEKTTIIVKAPVVYYSGLEGAHGDHAERIPTLEEHVLVKSREVYWKEWAQYTKRFVLLGSSWVIILGALGAYFPAFGAFSHTVTYFTEGLIKAIIRQAVLWSLEVLGNITRLAVGVSKVFSFLSYAVANTLAEWAGRDGRVGGPSWSVTATPAQDGWLPIWWWPSLNQSATVGEQVRYPRLDQETFKVLGKLIWDETRWQSYDSFLVGYIGKTAADWWAAPFPS